MLASLIKTAMLLAAIGEGLYLLWVLHRKGVLRDLLTDPRVLAWAGFAAATLPVCLWYARRIDLVKDGTLPREALAPAQMGRSARAYGTVYAELVYTVRKPAAGGETRS